MPVRRLPNRAGELDLVRVVMWRWSFGERFANKVRLDWKRGQYDVAVSLSLGGGANTLLLWNVVLANVGCPL